jgi:hypothetical protein
MTTLADRIRLLSESGLFDQHWYVDRYPDVLRCAMSPAEHFVRIGLHMGRKPSKDQSAAEASAFLAACRTIKPADNVISDELREKIFASRFFDASWYRARYSPDSVADADLLDDYFKQSAGNPLIDPGPLFSTSYYAGKNDACGSVAPLIHACGSGLSEGRPVLDPRKVNEFLQQNREVACSAIRDLLDTSQPVDIFCWEEGNFFFTEIAKYLEVYLSEAGYAAKRASDLPRSGARTHNIIVVAPHEFCVHGPGKGWAEQTLERAVYLNTEQWHTGWFSLAYRYMSMSNKAIDMNPASAAGLQSLGIQTAFLPITPLPETPFCVSDAPLSLDFAKNRYIRPLTYPAELSERPYDILFVGASNARREAALASLAPALAEHDAYLHCPRLKGPMRHGDPDTMVTSDLVQIARNSKILLNIHQGESRYFEWHRLFLFGIMEGCVVLTEPCIPNAFVEADRDYLECELEAMPERLHWLLETADGQSEMHRIRANCDRLRQTAGEWARLAA